LGIHKAVGTDFFSLQQNHEQKFLQRQKIKGQIARPAHEYFKQQKEFNKVGRKNKLYNNYSINYKKQSLGLGARVYTN
jgi:hypothetical protein